MGSCGNDNDLDEKEKQKTIQILRIIDKALEEDDGKIDFNEISSRHDWDRFCLVMAYSNPETELKEFINESILIEKIFPDIGEDEFGVGILFVRDRKVVDYFQIPSIWLPPSIDVGQNVGAISRVPSSGDIHIPPLNPTSTQPNDRPERTCYERKYTIKIHKNWKYTIVKRKG